VTRRLRLSAWVLVAAFVVVPLVEISALILVGSLIGPWWTIGLLIVDSLVGGWLIKREGSRAWEALSSALSDGRMPAKELADGALILVGGTLMLTPGFVTDVFGMAMILPVTRPLARRVLTSVVTRRLMVAGVPHDARHPGPGSGGSVVQGHVVDD